MKPLTQSQIDKLQLGPIVIGPRSDSNPIRFDYIGYKYYFWDETLTELYGPFNSKEECTAKLKEYSESL